MKKKQELISKIDALLDQSLNSVSQNLLLTAGYISLKVTSMRYRNGKTKSNLRILTISLITYLKDPYLRQSEITDMLHIPSRFDTKGPTHLAVRDSLFRLLKKDKVECSKPGSNGRQKWKAVSD